jgi:hypothetical protein
LSTPPVHRVQYGIGKLAGAAVRDCLIVSQAAGFMSNFPFGYVPIEPSTWAYLSSLLMLALFFKFNRFWSFRNVDLVLIILLAPGLLMVHYGHQAHQEMLKTRDNANPMALAMENGELSPSISAETGQTAVESLVVSESGNGRLSRHQVLERSGYFWLFVMGIAWIIRLLYDSSIKRKPMLEPNLSLGGLVFLMCSLMVFLFANVLMSRPADLSGPQGAVNIARRTATDASEQLQKYGPGYPMLHLIPAIPMFVDSDNGRASQAVVLLDVARIMAILSQIAIVAGLIFIGQRHFGSFRMGVGMGTIFLMLPYTAQFAGDSMHLLPGALLVWAIACYRMPLLAGILVGLAAGVCYYPFFLLPLWISFYWLRGRKRFTLGAIGALVVVVSSLAFTSADFGGFMAQVQSIFGFIIPRHEGLGGIWALNWDSWFRLPLLVVFIVMCVSYAFWPPQKDLSTLISCTAAAMVAVQFWHGQGGGLYMAWYLPLVLLVAFRPNLDDKIAIEVIEPPRSSPGDDLPSGEFAA